METLSHYPAIHMYKVVSAANCNTVYIYDIIATTNSLASIYVFNDGDIINDVEEYVSYSHTF